MKRGDEIVRSNEKDQFDFLKKGYVYISKSEWKKDRPIKKSKNKKEKK